TYTNSDENQPLVPGVLRSFVIPDNMWSLVVTQHIGQRFFINFNYAASSNYLAPLLDYSTFENRAYQFGGYQRADIGASYEFPVHDREHVRLYVKLGNVFDQNY